MPDWLIPVVIPVAVAIIAASGAWATTFVSMRRGASDARNTLIDQLQEERNHSDEQRKLEREAFATELTAEREQIAAERRENREMVDRFMSDKAASREYVNRLKDHIWQRHDPPPPEPPVGYIP